MVTTTVHGAMYYTAPDGIVYRVLDTVMAEGMMHAGNPPASWAKSRVFRPVKGHRRLYRFAKGDSREPTEEQLKRQFEAAEYLETEKFDPGERMPR
jgi:hypothetical protein